MIENEEPILNVIIEEPVLSEIIAVVCLIVKER
jgi:hypothetical protein